MSRRIEDLQPDVMFKVKAALAIFQQYEIPVVVTSTLRTQDEQIALYAQGRESLASVNAKRVRAGMRPLPEAENGYVVTRADGVKYKSNHQSGRALDVVPMNAAGNPVWPFDGDPRWKQISDVMKGQGFVWGGDWPPPVTDLPHYEATT